MHFVSTEADKGGLGRGELSFHSDCAFLPHPRIVLSLHAIDVVDAESSTKWISARSEEHTSELQSLMRISYAVFCLKKKTNTTTKPHINSINRLLNNTTTK